MKAQSGMHGRIWSLGSTAGDSYVTYIQDRPSFLLLRFHSAALSVSNTMQHWC